jgi:ribonuclease E
MILIDSAHVEETRVVVTDNGIIEDFEYQNSYKKSIKGNIYLAKVIRVEPSLQAAFIDYGNGRHGFLPFAEIHPSYYNLSPELKEQLLSSVLESESDRKSALNQEINAEQFEIDDEESDETSPPTNLGPEVVENDSEDAELQEESEDAKSSEESSEEREPVQFYKNYRIQEVIKKDQVILVQVVKEERGNKGASMTTYISLAGRYCVLMPNSFKAGGVSRKVADRDERQRLRDVSGELNERVGKSASIIIRTAGAYKTKTEIKRDFNYLIRLWNNIRTHTLASNAPAFIHEEGDVIKKIIRDVYAPEVEQILVAGHEGFENAKKFMEMIMPKHIGKVRQYRGKVPLFSKYGVEEQLGSLYSSTVSLKSGGYLIINHAEALVAIDVNSGRATSERNVEGTAFRTNTEAAYEIARQLKLRDLSGLIVIDFIDMDESRNRKNVERIFRDALRLDRARIQVGRISPFGLLEMSRQRLRHSFVESSTSICSHCDGRGRVRPVEATAVAVLRAMDSEAAIGSNIKEIKVSGSESLMFYLFNNKRHEIAEIEKKHHIKITFYIDNEAGADGFFIEKLEGEKESEQDRSALSVIDSEPYQDNQVVEEESAEVEVKNNRKRRKKWKKDDVISALPVILMNQEIAGESDGESQEINSEDDDSEEESEKVERARNKRKRRRVKNNNGHKIKERITEAYEEDIDFEKNMEDKRKQNQSFLKEIWKKIVE